MKYNGGIYLRLSKDDDCGSESSSISTQRSILREYARSHDIIIVREYVDDGFSGTDFNRPAFRRMIKDIESGEINCVLMPQSVDFEYILKLTCGDSRIKRISI